jgi:hypothetical protein
MLQEATDPAVSEAYAKMFLDRIEELALRDTIAARDFSHIMRQSSDACSLDRVRGRCGARGLFEAFPRSV